MNKQASILFNFISSSISGNSLALQEPTAQHSYYQRLIYSLLSRNIPTTESFQLLGKQLADIARYAVFARQMGTVEQASQIMLALPISSQLRSVARHYQALCAKQKGDTEGALRLFEHVAEEAPQYRARALHAIGATHYEYGEVDKALQFWVAAGKAAINRDLLMLVESQRGIAIIRSIHGDHKQALDDLEQMFPLVRAIGKHYPALYYDFLNSIAVELGEVGRIDEAKAACAIALASPFSDVYPNWSETRDEIAAKRTSATPSIVAVSAVFERTPSPNTQPVRDLKPARSLALIRSACKKDLLQRTITTIAATAIIARIEITWSILERVRHSINPRGPPARF